MFLFDDDAYLDIMARRCRKGYVQDELRESFKWMLSDVHSNSFFLEFFSATTLEKSLNFLFVLYIS